MTTDDLAFVYMLIAFGCWLVSAAIRFVSRDDLVPPTSFYVFYVGALIFVGFALMAFIAHTERPTLMIHHDLPPVPPNI